MVKKSEKIGVVGALGDLGRQVCHMLEKSGYEVVRNGHHLKSSVPLEQLIEECTVVHFCIAADLVPKLPVSPGTLFILHDSVMGSSQAVVTKNPKNQLVPVHMLMNKQRRVIVGGGFKGSLKASRHFTSIGQRPTTLKVQDHDRLIARSQAPLLLLIDTLLKDLRSWNKKGLLTPSAVDLLESLESREANWTPSTRQSILRNKQIKQFIKDLERSHSTTR